MRAVALWFLLLTCAVAARAQSSQLSPQSVRAWPTAKATIAVTINASSYQSFFFDLPSNVARLDVSTRQASANVDLLLRQGVPHSANSLQALLAESVRSATNPGGDEQLSLTTTDNPALTPGRWWFTVLNPGTTSVTLTLEASFTTAGNPFTPVPGLSGAWYEPAKSYQGFFFQILEGNQALATWFTFEPNGAQAYMIGVGPVVGDQVRITELIRTRGARFGAAFDAANVVREDWGDLVFTFTGCNGGYAAYLPSDLARAQGWPAEQLKLEHLTTIAGLPCGNGNQAKYLHGGISGAWYDPDRSGEGWLVEVLDAQTAFVYWFSYTPDGRQAWFGNVGRIEGPSIVIDEAIQPQGGRFGPSYNPAQVQLAPWGAFALTQTGCSTAVAAAVGPPNYGSVEYTGVVRLSTLAGTQACAFSAAAQTVSGTVLASAGAAVDGDVNDPGPPNIDNDTPAQEQQLSNPAIVSGYATATATGRAGDRFANTSDVFDAYTVPIAAGQVIRLGIAEHDTANPARVDLDLFLYAANDPDTPLAASEGTGPLEQITINQSGSYDIVVKAFAGGSNYVLSIDNQSGAATAALPGMLTLADHMVADEIVVGSPPGTPAKAARQRLPGALGLELRAGSKDSGWLMGIREPSDWAMAALRLGGPAAKTAAASPWGFGDVAMQRKQAQIEFIKRARARPEVGWAEPNWLQQAQAMPNDPLQARQWHYPFINLPQAWDLGTGSSNVVIAVLDTGVVPHADLTPNLRYDLGFDFIRSTAISLDNDGVDANADDVGDRSNPDNSSSFHGSHVAGTVAARGNNGTGVTGVNWTATLMPVRVLGSGGGTTYDIAQGIRWAAGLPNDSGRVPAQRANVINLSLGGTGSSCPQLYADAINAARSAGVIVVAAAGNNASSQLFFPAACPGVVSVSATDMVGQLAPYSNFGSTIDVAGPGGDMSADRNNDGQADGVLSTHASDSSGSRVATFNLLQGTSMATPHVAGVIGLMEAAFPNLSPSQFDQLLASGALTRDLAGNGASVRDNSFGYGLIDAFKSVAEARRLAGTGTIPAALSVEPTLLDFGTTASGATLAVRNAGGGTLNVQSVSGNRPWLSVGSGQLDSTQTALLYPLSIDRSGLVAASYSGQVVVQSSAGSFTVQVAMRVGGAATAGDLGTQYLLLVDQVTGVVVGQAAIRPQDGSYRFSFGNVMQGSYLLYTGSDHDNDGLICDAGDSCGAYTSIAQPTRIVVGNGSVILAPFVAMPDGRLLGAGAATASAPSGQSSQAKSRR